MWFGFIFVTKKEGSEPLSTEPPRAGGSGSNRENQAQLYPQVLRTKQVVPAPHPVAPPGGRGKALLPAGHRDR